MKLWAKEKEMFELIKKELYTPVVGDILDELGLYHQFLPQALQELPVFLRSLFLPFPSVFLRHLFFQDPYFLPFPEVQEPEFSDVR